MLFNTRATGSSSYRRASERIRASTSGGQFWYRTVLFPPGRLGPVLRGESIADLSLYCNESLGVAPRTSHTIDGVPGRGRVSAGRATALSGILGPRRTEERSGR